MTINFRGPRPYMGVVSYKPKSPEHDLQCACVHWFRLKFPDLAPLLFAVPNGGSRRVTEAARMKAEGVTPGVADLILLSPTNGPLLIEMKTATGRQSPEQKLWQKAVEGAGYRYVLCRSFDDFEKVINWHMTGSI